jgi:acetolactate synthase-1/2/3 large subunit
MRHRGHHAPIVKHNFLVKDVRDLAATMKKAFHIARTGRPGPWWWTSKDVSFKKALYTGYPQSVEMRSYNPARRATGPDPQGAAAAADRQAPLYLYRWRRVAGQCLQRAAPAGGHAGLPRHPHADGPGAYPASDRKFLGMLGMHGTIEANNAMQNCDVLLAVGAFDDRVIGNPKHFMSVERKIIHIDIDPSSISKRVKVDAAHRGRRQGCADRADRHDPRRCCPMRRPWDSGGAPSKAGATATA